MTHIGDTERQFLETPNSIKGACYDYHGNVFINNQCKIILNNYEKLCGVVSNEPEFHEHISGSGNVYLRKGFCPQCQKKVKNCTKFLYAFQNERITQ